jgi:tetratricopeptide (TPR) repeat protein
MAASFSLLAVMAMRNQLYFGPHLIGYLFFCLIALWITGLLRANRKNVLLAPLLMVLWANCHGSFIFGFLLLLIYLCWEILLWRTGSTLQNYAGPVSTEHRSNRLRYLGIATGGSLIGALINPHGLWTVIYPFPKHSLDTAFRALIPQWGPPPIPWQAGLDAVFTWFWIFWLFAVVGILITLWIRRHISLLDLVLTVVLVILSVRSMHYIPYFCILTVPFIAAAFRDAASWKEKLIRQEESSIARIHSLAPPGWIVMILFFIFTGQQLSNPVRNIEPGLGVHTKLFPEKLASFLKEVSFPGPLYNQLNYGPYLVWRLYPQYKIFIDNRFQIYGEELILATSDINRGAENATTLLDQFGTNIVVLNRTATALSVQLFRDENWKIVYWDDTGVVFVRANETNLELAPAGYFENVYPFDNSLSFLTQENAQSVMEELDRKLKWKFDLQTLLLLGLINEATGQDAEAIKFLNRVVSSDPLYPGALIALARIYGKQGMNDESLRILQKGIRLDPRNPYLYNFIGQAYELMDRPGKADQYYRKALAYSPLFEPALRNHLRLSQIQGWITEKPIRGLVERPSSPDAEGVVPQLPDSSGQELNESGPGMEAEPHDEGTKESE